MISSNFKSFLAIHKMSYIHNSYKLYNLYDLHNLYDLYNSYDLYNVYDLYTYMIYMNHNLAKLATKS